MVSYGGSRWLGASIAGTSTASSEMAKAEKVSKESAVQQRERQSGPKWGGRPVPVQQLSGGPSGRWRVGSEPQRASRDAMRQAARDRVAWATSSRSVGSQEQRWTGCDLPWRR